MHKGTQFTITGKMVRDMSSKSPRERLLHRAHCVALVIYGFSASEVARIFQDSPRAISYWVTRFKNDGMKGLDEDSRPGRPSKLVDQEMQRLAQFIKDARTASKPVNAEMLAKHIRNEFGVSLTIRQCARILKRVLSGSTLK
jgi:transposase